MGKTCRTCGKTELTSSVETYLYAESGLPNVTLVGIEIRRCSTCGDYEIVLPRVTDLHRAIAHAVITKRARLSGAEVRYLRKYLGWSGVDFAKHIGAEPSTVLNWETDKDPIGMASDRLLRLMVVHGSPVENYPLEELTKIENERRPPLAVRLSPNANGWMQVPQAA
jgi:putative zinc finger/helix-turn-helix YgiT family protein